MSIYVQYSKKSLCEGKLYLFLPLNAWNIVIAYFRNVKDSQGIKDHDRSMSEDVLAPFITSSIVDDKDKVPKSTASTPTSSPHREVSKLGLFSFVGLAIVLFQVRFRFHCIWSKMAMKQY